MTATITIDGFGSRLRDERMRMNLTQEQMGELGGVKRVSQHLYETGKRMPDLQYLERVTRAGADTARLLFSYSTQTEPGRQPDLPSVNWPLLSSVSQRIDGWIAVKPQIAQCREDLIQVLYQQSELSGVVDEDRCQALWRVLNTAFDRPA